MPPNPLGLLAFLLFIGGAAGVDLFTAGRQAWQGGWHAYAYNVHYGESRLQPSGSTILPRIEQCVVGCWLATHVAGPYKKV